MSSLVKGFGAVLCLIFALSFAAPNAVADEFTYTYVLQFQDFDATFTTNPIAAVTAPTTILAADLASFSLGDAFQGSTFVSLTLDAEGAGSQEINCAPNGCIGFQDFYTLSDYGTPGTYTSLFSTLTVTDVTATPEPSSLALMLAGVGLVFAMRKRFSGLHQT